MNNKYIFFVFLLKSLIFLAQEKTLVVTYKQGILDKRITKSNNVKFFKGVEYKLVTNVKESEFKLINKMSNNEYNRNRKYIAKVGGFGVYYTNLETKERLNSFKAKMIGKNISIKEKLIDNWKLLKDKKKINKYTCYKALYEKTTKIKGIKDSIITNYTVWYTPSLHHSFGPLNINGLPGLILEIEFENNYFIASEIKILNKNSIIERPKYQVMTHSEFYEILQRENILNLKKKYNKNK